MGSPRPFREAAIWKLLFPSILLLCMVAWLFVSDRGSEAAGRERVSVERQERPGVAESQPAEARRENPEPTTERPAPVAADSEEKELWENRDQLLAWAKQGDAAKGMKLARRRGELMAALIPRDPDLALEAMLPLPVYLKLPAEMRDFIERPFAVAGALDVVPDCERGGLTHSGVWEGGRRLLHFAAGRGERVSSKNRISLSGVELGGVAAVHGSATWMMDGEEMAAARQLFGIKPASGIANALVAGDALYLDAEGQERVAMLHSLSEELPGPDTGAVLALMNAPGEEETAALLRDVRKVSESWTLADKRILFLNLKFADSSAPAESSAGIQAKLTQCGTRTEEMSYGKMRFSRITVSDVLTLAGNAASYDLTGDIDYHRIRNEGMELAVGAGLISGTASSDFTKDYDIIGVVFPSRPTAPWGGRGTIAGSGHWINGNVPFGVYIHEFGHNYGLQHASRWNESDPALNPPTPPTAAHLSTSSSTEPRHIEYGDGYDYMGSSGSGHDFGAFGKNRLSWIDDGATVEMTGNFPGDRTVRLQAFDEPGAHNGAVLGARVQMQESETFWVYYRGHHPDSRAQAGANVLWQFASNQGRLLDMSPESTASMDFVLKPGRSYSDPSGMVNITALAQGESDGRKWLDVRLVTGVSGNSSPVLAGLSAPQSGKPLQNRTFTANATDADGDTLLYNWDFGDGRQVTTGESTLTHSYLVGGTYVVRIGVLDGRGGYVEGQHSITINDPVLDLTKASLGSTGSLQGIVYAGGRFFACDFSQVWTSFDGLEWETMPQPTGSKTFHGIGSAGNRVILVGSSFVDGQTRGAIWESVDGLSWSVELMPAGVGALRGYAEANGVRVVGGNNGALLAKMTGGAWQTIPLGETRQFRHVFHGGGRFWALGQDGLALFSSNGLDWSPPPAIPAGTSWSDFTTGTTAGGKTYLAGEYGRLGVSADTGASWLDTYDGTADLSGMTGIPGRVLCFERSYNNDLPGYVSPGILATKDGSVWARAALPAGVPVNQATYGAGRVVAAGDRGTIHASGIVDSANKAPTGNVSLPASVNAREDFSPTGSYSDTDGDALRYFWDLGNGWFNAGPKPVFKFLFGGTRTVRLAVLDGRGGLRKQTFEVSVEDPFRNFSVIGDSGSEGYSDVASAGGKVFALSWGKLHSGNVGGPLSALPSIGPMYPNGLASDGTDLVLVGQTYDSPTQSWVGGISRGPVTGPVPLAKVDIPAGGHFNAVAHGGGTWVAVGNGGRISSSVAGGAWADRVSGVSGTLSGIAYGNGTFMAAGAGGAVLVSANGIDWTLKPAPSSSSLSKVVFCGNGFLVGGGSGLHFTADLGANWKSPNLTNFSFTTAAWTGDAILALGRFYDFDRARWVGHLLVSLDGAAWEKVEDESLLNARDVALSGSTLVAVGESGLQAFTRLVEPPPPVIWIIQANPSVRVRIGIASRPGEVFDVFRSGNLKAGFGDVPYATGIPAASSGEFTEWIDNAPLTNKGFYRVRRKQ
jgi:hypothetical protein